MWGFFGLVKKRELDDLTYNMENMKSEVKYIKLHIDSIISDYIQLKTKYNLILNTIGCKEENIPAVQAYTILKKIEK